MYYRVEPLFPGLTRIWDVTLAAMYLVEGKDKAILIDTGAGVGDLSSVISDLTGKPVTVLVTHGHVDHALGARSFDDVRISPLEKDVYARHCEFEGRKRYVLGATFAGVDSALLAGITDEDYLQPLEFERFAPLAPGDCFELGGVSVEVLPGAGHTPGTVTLLIPEWRVLLLCDACNQFTYLFEDFATSLTAYRDMLRTLKEKTDGRYDRVLFSHGTGEGAVDMIDRVLAVCDEVLSGGGDNIPFRGLIGDGVIAKAMDFQRFCRADGGEGNLVYNPNNLW